MQRINRVSKWSVFVIVGISAIFGATAGITSDAQQVASPEKIVSQSIEDLSDGGTLRKTSFLAARFFDENMYAPEDISDAGKHVLQDFADHIVTAHKDYAQRFPGLSTTIAITLTSYSRQAAFPEDFSLIHKITANGKIQLPAHDPERRQFLNHCLSAFRSRTLGEYLEQTLADYEQQHPLLNIKYIIEGKGEQQAGEQADSEQSQQYAFSAEIKARIRGPRVTHPTDILLYEVQEEE